MKSWLEIQNRIQHISTVISCVLNSILIFLILKYSPKSIGTYKWLMVYISLFQMLYSFMDVISLPVYHTVSSVFVVFKDVRHFWIALPESLHIYLLVAYTGCYGFCMAVFGIHFYYRYLAISGKTALRTFKGHRIIFWLLIPPTFAFIWALTAGIFFASNPETRSEIENSVLDSYDLKMDDIVYIAAFLWPKDPITGRKHLNMMPTIGIAIEEMIVVAVFYFGMSCYDKINAHVGTFSKVTRHLHRQLFYALVLQTTIPMVLLHLPVSGLFMFPLLDLELGFFTGFVTITIALYPAIDPLPTMFVIENYRNAIVGFFATVLCRKTIHNNMANSQFSSSVV